MEADRGDDCGDVADAAEADRAGDDGPNTVLRRRRDCLGLSDGRIEAGMLAGYREASVQR